MSFTADIDQIVAENRNGLLGARSNWKRAKLKDVATILNGYPFESSRFSKDTGTPLIRIRDVVPGRTETYYEGEFDPAFLVQRGDLLVGMDGDFNSALWGGDQALLNQRVCKIQPDESKYSKRFLSYVLPGYLAAINAHTPSVTVKHLSSRTVADIPLPLPPIDEQRRIVAEIEKQFTRLDAGVAALRRVQANLKRYRAAVLKAACEGRLVKSNRALWKSKTVDTLTSLVTKGSSPNWQGFEYSDSGIVFVRSQNVGWGRLDLSDVARLPEAFNQKEKKSVIRTGDVLLNIVGASIGRAAVAPSEIDGGNVNQAVAVIRPRTEVLSAQFLKSYLLCEKTQALIHSQKVDVARANFSLEQIRNIPVQLPPLAEQECIVAEIERRLSVIEGLETAVSANFKRANRLRQALLRDAFSGKLAGDPIGEIVGTPVTPTEPSSGQHMITQAPRKKRTTPSMPAASGKSLAELIDCLIRLGGEAAPGKLLSAAGLGDDVERFFDLLREGQKSGVLSVPTGKVGLVSTKRHAS